jgi:hypothetical protein
MLQAQIARGVGVSESTVSRVLARAGLSKLSDLRPLEPVQRYEHEASGDLLHIDTKKLGRILRPSHRVTGDRRDGVDGAGWETLFVAIDDHARIAFLDRQLASVSSATLKRRATSRGAISSSASCASMFGRVCP